MLPFYRSALTQRFKRAHLPGYQQAQRLTLTLALRYAHHILAALVIID
jgi:hypothetical protein